MIRIDVLTVTLNSAATLMKCLLSVQQNRRYISKFIVIDGDSSDNSKSIISNFSSIIDFFVSEPDSGISDAFNKGIKHCDGDFVLILNSDDFLFNNSLQQASYLLTNTDEVVFTQIVTYDFFGRSRLCFSIPKFLSKYNSALHPGCLINRSIYSSLGEYDTSFKIAMDYDFFCRCFLSNIKFRLLPITLVSFSTGGVSQSSNLRSFVESFRIRRKYFNVQLPIIELYILIKSCILFLLKIIYKFFFQS